MSTTAQAIVQQIKALPADEQREILAGLGGIFREDDTVKSAQRAAIKRVRGMFSGGSLLQALLDERAKDRLREHAGE